MEPYSLINSFTWMSSSTATPSLLQNTSALLFRQSSLFQHCIPELPFLKSSSRKAQNSHSTISGPTMKTILKFCPMSQSLLYKYMLLTRWMSEQLLGPDTWFQTFNTEAALGKYVLESHPLLSDNPPSLEGSERMLLQQEEFTLVYKEKL